MTDQTPLRDDAMRITTSRHFNQWLSETGGSIAITTYQVGKLFLIGLTDDAKLSVFGRHFDRAMGVGLSPDGRSFFIASRAQIQRFDATRPAAGQGHDGHDAVFMPHAGWITGDLDAHDMGWGHDDRPVFVNTAYGCIATVSDGHSFRPLWKPPFLSKLAAEDRCHLNGLAMCDGAPAYVTAVSRSDVADGWRDQRRDGGVVIDVATSEIIADGLSMPHSPRLEGDRLWVLNSGRGEIGFVDPTAGRFEPVALCPGYGRGLAIHNGHAIVGLSLARESGSFGGLDLDGVLDARQVAPRCGLAVFNLATGDMEHWLRIEGPVRELFDVTFVPGIRRPSAPSVSRENSHTYISIDAGAADPG